MAKPSEQFPAPDSDEAMILATTKNIDGAFDFIRTIVSNPSRTDEIPTGATIILESEDDPITTARNKKAAAKAEQQGKTVHVHHVRRPS